MAVGVCDEDFKKRTLGGDDPGERRRQAENPCRHPRIPSAIEGNGGPPLGNVEHRYDLDSKEMLLAGIWLSRSADQTGVSTPRRGGNENNNLDGGSSGRSHFRLIFPAEQVRERVVNGDANSRGRESSKRRLR